MVSVLIVDKDPILLEAIRDYLSRVQQVKVRIAKTGPEALSILESNVFDAIILENDIPEINGISVLRILRGKGNTTPVIMFASGRVEHTAIEALNNGADYFVKKGDNPLNELRPILDRIEQVLDGRTAGRPIGSEQKILTEVINFSSDPSLAIDHEGKIIAWNEAIEHMTGLPASAMLRKGDFAYSEPFLGRKGRMLIDLVFEKEEIIQKHNYLVISHEKNGPVIAVTKGKKPDGSSWTLWMKVVPIYDQRGRFIAAIGSVRDITATVKDLPLPEPEEGPESPVQKSVLEESPAPAGSLFDRILGTAMAAYREGVLLYAREQKYHEAIAAFDHAISIEPGLAPAWNERGICYRHLGEYDNALKSFVRAVELAPDDVGILYDLGETLEQIGMQQRDSKYLDAALQTFHMVVEKLPNNASAWNHIGVCLKEMGKPEESKIYFDRARDVKLWKKDTPIPRKRDEYL